MSSSLWPLIWRVLLRPTPPGLLLTFGLALVLSISVISFSQSQERLLVAFSKAREAYAPSSEGARSALGAEALARLQVAAGSAPMDEHARPLEVCEKSFTFHLSGRHGMGSEVLLLVRAASVARAYGYTNLFIDDTDWNYGHWIDHFLPPSTDCLPPSADPLLQVREMRLTKGDLRFTHRPPVYTQAKHIKWDWGDVNGLDWSFTRLFADEGSVKGLLRSEESLEGEEEKELVPGVWAEAFRVQSEVLRAIWRPNALLQSMMDEFRAELGMSHTLERTDEIAIAVHCRLGDKWKELRHFLPVSEQDSPRTQAETGLDPALLDAFFNAATSIVERIVRPDDYPIEEESRWSTKPKLALMSDDSGALARFEDYPEANRWRVQGTAPVEGPSKEEDKELNEPSGFSQQQHNALPPSARVDQARKFVRELTVLAESADGLVLTASSNVGRLMALLAGPEKAIDRARVRSLDTAWFPTAWFPSRIDKRFPGYQRARE